MKPSDYCETHGAHKHACRKEHPMTPDKRLAALLADPKVDAEWQKLRHYFGTMLMTVERISPFLSLALDRSAPETHERNANILKRIHETLGLCEACGGEGGHGTPGFDQNGEWMCEMCTECNGTGLNIPKVPETPEAVREAAHIAVGRFLPPSLQREAANIVDAVAPILRAADQVEIARWVVAAREANALLLNPPPAVPSPEHLVVIARRVAQTNADLLAENVRLTARLAVVEGAVWEWREAKKALKEHGTSHADFLGGDPEADALRARLNNATDALTALSLAAPRE